MAQVSSLWDGCGARGTRTWSAGSFGLRSWRMPARVDMALLCGME
jgi:hypothetical protein